MTATLDVPKVSLSSIQGGEGDVVADWNLDARAASRPRMGVMFGLSLWGGWKETCYSRRNTA